MEEVGTVTPRAGLRTAKKRCEIGASVLSAFTLEGEVPMKMLATAALAVCVSVPLQAQVVLSDNFDAEAAPGTSVLNYSAFANWEVIGQVDLVQSGDFGITCSTKCVDLDGSSGPGRIRTRQAFNVLAGDTWTFAFSVSGSQRRPDLDNIFMTALFGGSPTIGAFTGTGGFSSVNIPGFGPLDSFTAINSIAGTSPFSTWSVSFQAQSAGTVKFELGTVSADNIGPLIDNVMISKVSAQVPEPSSAFMLLLGLGAVGLTARRRRALRS
jgi:hypothetical protein